METKINIAAILKDKPQGTKLFSPICGECKLSYVESVKSEPQIGTESDAFGAFYFWDDGKAYVEGECMLFPSKKMHDWSKFSWRKGDVLKNTAYEQRVFFDGFLNDDYTYFKAKHPLDCSNKDNITYHEECSCFTGNYRLESTDAALTYINTIEERLGGKLNMETLEIEKPKKPKKKPVFELGNLYVFNEQDEDGELTIIGKLIGKNESEDTLTFGNQYETENEKFVTDQVFDLRISVHNELREATEGEAITFQEAYTIWEKSKKQSAIKPFDKVLVRDSESDKWRANLFGYIGKDGYYCCVYANWIYCIPYEGNEHLLGTTKDVEG